jgi:hypothetical protein
MVNVSFRNDRGEVASEESNSKNIEQLTRPIALCDACPFPRNQKPPRDHALWLIDKLSANSWHALAGGTHGRNFDRLCSIAQIFVTRHRQRLYTHNASSEAPEAAHQGANVQAER